jgi:hypothetical protein
MAVQIAKSLNFYKYVYNFGYAFLKGENVVPPPPALYKFLGGWGSTHKRPSWFKRKEWKGRTPQNKVNYFLYFIFPRAWYFSVLAS